MEKPPVLTHFSETSCIYILKAPFVEAPVLAPTPIQAAPAPHVSIPAASSNNLMIQLAMTNPTLAQLLLQQQLQQCDPPQYQPHPYVYYPPNPPQINPNPIIPVIALSTPLPATPLSPAAVFKLPRIITLHEFCEHFLINTIDKAKLEKLTYKPGNKNVVKLDREEWQGFTGFAKLG